MTPAEFCFVSPDGIPIAIAPLIVQLVNSNFDAEEFTVSSYFWVSKA